MTLARVRSALRRNDITNHPPPSLTIELDQASGELLLSGVADDRAFKDEAERLALEVPGIASVRNELISGAFGHWSLTRRSRNRKIRSA